MKEHKIKILHITQSFGGVQTFIVNILTAVNNENIEFAVACQKSDFSKQIEKTQVKWFPVDFVREPNIYRDFIAFFQLIKVIYKFHPTIIHSHSAKAGYIGRLVAFITKTKVIYTPNAFSFLGFTGYKKLCFLFMERVARHFTTTLHVVSASERDLAIKLLKYRNDKIELIPNSIRVQQMEIKEYHFKEKNNYVGMIGRLIYQKNPEMFVNVAVEVHKHMPAVKFVLLGEGYLDFLKERIRHLIDEKNASEYIKIYRWGDGVNSKEFLKQIDIFILTSRFEGLPFSLLEAMANGIPSVVTNADGNRDVITHGTDGYIVEHDDIVTMAEHIVKLLLNDVLRQKIGLAGNKKVRENFNLEINRKNYLNMYSKLLGNTQKL